MEDSRLAERIADAHQEVDSKPVGYLGHLREIANELVRAGKLLEPIGVFLSSRLGRECDRPREPLFLTGAFFV